MDTPFIASNAALDDAVDLIDAYGPHAMSEAASRAKISRSKDNLVRWVHWRQIERMIPMLVAEKPEGSVH
jgi:hypothetical protein